MKPMSLAGERFGRLLVLHEAPRLSKDQYMRYWHCRCDCGKECDVPQKCLRRGTTKSCGCWKAEVSKMRQTTHGRSGSPEYRCWCSMKRRCLNPTIFDAPLYRDRGITVCDLWKDSFEAFLKDMGPRPGLNWSIDRIDNSLGYEKSNCRWATMAEQAVNTRRNRIITHHGVTRTLSQWAAVLRIDSDTLAARLDVYHWSIEDTLETP